MLWIFDMDGTIVDSRAAVREAYKRAGVKMPDDAWGRPWREWLSEVCGGDDARAHEVHEEKCRAYWNTVREMGRPLPALELLGVSGGWVITGASPEAVDAVREALDFNFRCLGTQLSDSDKVHSLVSMAQSVDRLMYVDDTPEVGEAAMAASSKIVFLRVTEHDGVFHLYENPARGPKGERRVMRWTLSSWLLGATID